MLPRPRKVLLQAWIAIAFCVCVAGCATPATTAGGIASARDAQAALVIGKSTKAQVEAALGKAIVVSFDSGYEVWVYRERVAPAGFGLFAQPPKEKSELVLLFEPAGVLKKSRVRGAG
jgi:outer membrane protein assembly factor BamE (lipoprotein component of BamABCDE complex)